MAARTFADEIVETSTTFGTTTYQLGGAKGSYRRFRAGYDDGETRIYYGVRNSSKTKWELHRGATLTHGSPDTLSRNVFLSTNGNAAVSWTAEDHPLTIYVPSAADVLEAVLTGWLNSARHALVRTGAFFWTYSDALVSWTRKLATGDATAIDVGMFSVAKSIYVPFANAPIRDTTTSGSTIAATDRGWIILHDSSAAARVAALGAAATLGEGFYVGVYFDGIFPGLIDTNGSEAVDNAVIPPRQLVWLRCTGSKWFTTGNSNQALIGRRQTVTRGPLSTGAPNVLATVSGLALSTSNVAAAAPLVVRASNGDAERWGWATGNVSFGTLTNTATNYLFVTVGVDGLLTGGKTTLVPIYQESGTPSTTSGQFTFNYGEMKGYLGNGLSADEVFMVFVGEAVTSGGNVTAVTAYAYNGRYDSGYTATLPTGGTGVTKNHNIGVVPLWTDFRAQNTTTDAGWAVGEEISIANMTGYNGTSDTAPVLGAGAKTMTVNTSGNPYYVLNKSSGVSAALTLASWKYRMIADRGW